MKKFKLAFLTTHPIQYQAPLFRVLASHPEIDLTVYFCSKLGLESNATIDPGFGVPVKWDIPLLEGYSYRFLTNFSWQSNPQKIFAFLNPGILKELFIHRYDSIIVHGYAVATNWLAFASRIPVILHGETVVKENKTGVFGVMKRTFLSLLFSRVKAFLYIGEKSRLFYENFGIANKRLFFSPYCINNDFFREQAKQLRPQQKELRRACGVDENKPVILYASKLTFRKRPLDLLKAFEPHQDQASLVYVGDGEARTVLQDYATKNAIKNVYFLGFKNQTELPRYYSMADIFVLPSSFEPWGLVINEAMCFDLPILTTDQVAAAADLVTHGENGYVLPVGDIETLSVSLKKLILSKDERRRMGEASAMKISTWNYNRCVDGILDAVRYVHSL